MAIDRLSSTATLIAAMRSDVLRKMEQAQRPAPVATTQADTAPRSSANSVTHLRNQLIDMVKDVDPTDAQSVRHARTRVVRSILLWEYGHEFRDHSEWRPLMDRIDAALDADDAQSVTFINLLASLKSHKLK